MDDTTIVAENVEVVRAGRGPGRSALSWGAVIAGALTAVAVGFLIMALGSGIGFAIASPYGSGPSAETMTIAGAVWLVFAQAAGFAVGGYVAGRLHVDASAVPPDESKFRDGAHGFTAWAIGVVVMIVFLAAAGALTIGTAARAGTSTTAGLATNAGPVSADALGYFVDALFRPNGPSQGNPQGNPNVQVPREEATRILVRSVALGRLADDDKSYLATVVAARTGLSAEDASRRIDDVVNRARESVKQAAETSRRVASYVSFWTFMSLVFGAVAASIGAVVGGQMRESMAT
jgi:hypothetical protein